MHGQLNINILDYSYLAEEYFMRETTILIRMKLNTLKNAEIYQKRNTGRS